MKLSELLQSNTFEETEEICPGCQNHCQVRCYHFANGRSYFSGNNCERVYSNEDENASKGVNMFDEKYKMLFQQRKTKLIVPLRLRSGLTGAAGLTSNSASGLTIGLPRGLGIYENYPFWQTLFGCCGVRVRLSAASSNRLFEKGVRTIVADNICYPAKLMHGHIMDLIENMWTVFSIRGWCSNAKKTSMPRTRSTAPSLAVIRT